MTLEEFEIYLVQKYGFKKTDHPNCYVSENIRLWLDDKITICILDSKPFSKELNLENLQRADLYLQDLMKVVV